MESAEFINKRMQEVVNQEIVVSTFKAILDKWEIKALILESLLISLGIVAICCSLSITAFADYDFMRANHSIVVKIFEFISILCLSLIGSFNLPVKANNARKAFRHLSKAYYRYNSYIISIKELVVAHEEAEEIIGTIDFNYSKGT